MATTSAFTLAASHSTDTMNSREGKSMTLSGLTHGWVRPDNDRNGGEGGILTLSLWASYHVFSNLHENRMNIGDFYRLSFFNSFNCSA